MIKEQIHLSQNHFADWMQSPDIMVKRCRRKTEELTDEQKKLCEFGHMIHSRAKLLYPEGIEPCDNRNFESRMMQSKALLKARIPLFESLFDFNGISAQTDILLPADNDSWELIEVKSNKTVHDTSIQYAAFQYYVCVKTGVKISKVSIMHLKSWVDKNTPLDQIFDKTDITDRVVELQDDTEKNIEKMKEIYNKRGRF